MVDQLIDKIPFRKDGASATVRNIYSEPPPTLINDGLKKIWRLMVNHVRKETA